jgi:hypothetical protein
VRAGIGPRWWVLALLLVFAACGAPVSEQSGGARTAGPPASAVPVPAMSPSATPPVASSAPPPEVRRTPAAVRSPRVAPLDEVPVATRVMVPSMAIDLPVVSETLDVPGNEDGYPLCDVAQFLRAYRQPSQPGTTYLYAHAREGMFLPLLEASWTGDDGDLIGRQVLVHTADGTIHRYEISAVRRSATDFQLADRVRPGDRALVMQTSEGPEGTVPKLQVAARHLDSTPGSVEEANPRPRPRACR